MLAEKSWRNTNIDDVSALSKEKKKGISESYIPGAFGLNEELDLLVSTEEEEDEAEVYFRCRHC